MNFSFIFCQNYFQLEVYKLHACIKSFCPLKSATYYIQMQWLCIFKSSWIQFDGEYLIWYKTAAQYFVFVEAPMFSFLSHFFSVASSLKKIWVLWWISYHAEFFFKLIYRHRIHLRVLHWVNLTFPLGEFVELFFGVKNRGIHCENILSKPRLTYRVFVRCIRKWNGW